MTRTPATYEIDLLGPETAHEALAVAACMVDENQWQLTFDMNNALRTIETFIASDDCDVIAVRDATGEVIGGALVYANAGFTVEKIGGIHQFYVMPYARATPATRQLLQACMAWFREQDTQIVLATQWSNIEPRIARLFENLLKKAGMKLTGNTYIMEMS